MPNIEIATTTGRMLVLNAKAIEQFHTGLRGGHLLRGDGGYDAARKIYNAMIDHQPAIIARCAGATDVISAINFARNNGLLVSVRGGGHNVSGNAVCDGGLMIDLSPMKSVRVDPQGKTVRAEAGVTWGEFDRETQAFGLATTGGLVSTTGIAGLTLGGGLGWLMGKYGLACDNLISVDVLTADGRLLTASKSRNEDLFWGLRGGGGNFGIATSFEFQLHPVGPMLGGILIHRLDKAAEIIRFYDDFTRTSPDELGTFVAFVTSPEGERVVAIFVCYNGAVEEGQRILKPLREFGPPLADMIGPMPYVQVQRMMDDGFPATTSQASLAFARGGGLHSEDPWNPQHIDGLPAEVRNDLARMCSGSRAEHQFASYFQNSRVLILHFEHFRCSDRGALCTQAGCLHQVYISTGGRYRLLRSYYAPEGD